MRSYITLITLLGTTTILSSVAHAESPSPEDEFKIEKTEVIGGNGGGAITEDKSTYLSGPITAIRVCAGSRLDSITVTYGRRQGRRVGNNGGSCNNVKMTAGDQITGIRYRLGSWIDGIQFEVNNSFENTVWHGGLGGDEGTVRSNGGALAFIEGRVGSKVDQLSFSFGLPYRIVDVEYDQKAVNDQIKNAPIVDLSTQCFINQTSVEQAATAEFSETVSKSQTWNFETSTEWGVEANYSFGVEGLGEAGFSISAGGSVSRSEGGENSEQTQLTKTRPTNVPAFKTVEAVFQASKKDVNIPFTYKIAHYENGDRNNMTKHPKVFQGMFAGVSYTNDNIIWDEVSACKVGTKPLLLGAPETPPAVAPPTPQPVLIAPRPITVPTPQPDYVENDGYDAPSTYSSLTETLSFAIVSNGGMFERIEPGIWEEVSADGGVFTFDVVDRDEDCIYLLDRNRGVIIVIDIPRSKIRYAPDSTTEPFDLYDIVDKG